MAAKIKNKSFRFKRIYLVSTGAIIILLVVTILALLYTAINPYHPPDKPHPLGDRLEYIGRTEAGKYWGDGSSYSETYYYATDMTPRQVIDYFEKATLDDTSNIPTETDSQLSFTFSLTANGTKNPIYIHYYPSGQERIKQLGLQQSDKKHTISLQDEDYQAAKDSL